MIYYNKHLKFFYCTINLLQNCDQFNSFIFILQMNFFNNVLITQRQKYLQLLIRIIMYNVDTIICTFY